MNSTYFRHETAKVDTETIGRDTTIWAFVHILKGAHIGSNVNICDHCFIEGDVKIGNNVTIKCGVYLWDGVIVEDNVFIGPNATFTNDKLPRSKNKNYKKLSTTLKRGSSIGANATILGGLEIGEFAMVAAGSVVTRSVPNYALVMGNPARLQGYVCKCGLKLTFTEDLSEAKCECGHKYSLEDSKVINQD
ncbi:N-acetyltransferase [Candidatus Woesebacteria bacterium]|nr:N-acetyltransferase [Candidatus Woesebacteria bacterium]